MSWSEKKVFWCCTNIYLQYKAMVSAFYGYSSVNAGNAGSAVLKFRYISVKWFFVYILKGDKYKLNQ